MIMISSGAAQKVGKPPPPVPPRPSKTVVAEALAKSRQYNKTTAAAAAAAKTKSPARQAPPPPIAKSKSSYSVNVTLKKPVVFERSISEEVKNNARTVVYQSSNVKCNNNNNSNGNGVLITREEDEVKIVNSNGAIFRNRDGVRVVGKQGGCDGEENGRVEVFRKESVKKDKFCREKRVITEGGKRTFEIVLLLGRGNGIKMMMVHLEKYTKLRGIYDRFVYLRHYCYLVNGRRYKMVQIREKLRLVSF